MNFKKLLYQNVFWRGLNLLSFFVLTAGMARCLGASVSGQVFFVVNFYALVLLMAGLSGEAGLGFFTANQQLSAGSAALLALCWTAVATFLFLLLLPWFTRSGAVLPIPRFNGWLLLYLGGYLLLVFFTALFHARQNFVLPNAVAFAANILLIALLPWQQEAVAINHFLQWYLLAFSVQGLLLAAVFVARYGKGTWAWPGAALRRQLLRYSLQAFAANLLFFLVYRIDYWLVNYFCADKALLGNYIQVSKLAQAFFILPGIVATTVFSVTAAGQKATMPQTVQRLGRLIFMGALLACGLLAGAGPWLFPAVFGPEFGNMYGPFVLLVPGILAIATLYPYTAYYAGNNRIRLNIVGNLLALGVIVVADSLLIPIWNIKGAALASSLGYLVYQAWVLWHFKKEQALRWRDCFIVQKEDWGLLKAALVNKRHGV
jgi:O-antigen/teichoic acid export membrane protein